MHTTPTARCDNASVGILIADQQERWLMFTRATPPWGIAPAAGHVFDDHCVRDPHTGEVAIEASYRRAAEAEVAEELGLQVTALQPIADGWRLNACRRLPGPAVTGHQWRIFRAQVTGDLVPSARETSNVRWFTRAELQDLAARTVLYAWGRITDAAFYADPGIEPVWCYWLVQAGLITMAEDDLEAIEEFLAEQAMRTRDPHITIEITYRSDNEQTQTLYGEVDDQDHLARLQALTRADNAAGIVIPLSARLTVEGTDFPRVFYADRVTFRELQNR
ncbi:NUDIX domain-containing protein [Nonomuraea sp. NPDC050536]|uniref:NUDIX domain-containing protein n=1 Tax=Nonomuraea sp. NPDC050536 TaxID=3364366 RepID=UPI0037CC75F0